MTDQLIFNSGFFITPNDIFELEELSMKEKLVFVYLCRCSNNGSSAFPSYSTIGKKCSVSRMTAIDAVKGLVQKGIIQKTERIENGENTSNTYRILWGSQKFVPPLVQNFDQGSTKSGPYKELSINNSSINSTAAAENFYQAHKRVFGFELNPIQAEKLGSYLDDGMEEAVLVRAIERAGTVSTGYKFRLIEKVADDYFRAGALTLDAAKAIDEAHEANKQTKTKRPSKQQNNLSLLEQMREEERKREQK